MMLPAEYRADPPGALRTIASQRLTNGDVAAHKLPECCSVKRGVH